MARGTWLLVIVSLWPSLAGATITRGPLLGNVTETAVTLRWFTDQPSLDSVQYGLSQTALTQNAAETGTATTDHQVRLTGLSGSTKYYYSIISGTATATGASLFFTTAPSACEPFRFAVVGDTRGATSLCDNFSDWQKVAALIDSQSPEILIGTGDWVYAGESTSCWDNWFGALGTLFEHTPFFPAMGNHDYATQTYTDETNAGLLNFSRWFSLPQGPEVGKMTTYYSFTFGNSHFVVYDAYKDHSPTSAQYQFIVSELAAAQADPNIQHSFLIDHPTFEGASQFCLIGEQAQKDNQTWIEPLTETYEVDATLVGHEHCYERATKNGVEHVVTGGGGAPSDNMGVLCSDPVCPTHPNLVKFDGCTYHALFVEVSGSHISFTALAEDGTTVIDSWTHDHWTQKQPTCVAPSDGGQPPADDAGAPRDAAPPPDDVAADDAASDGGGPPLSAPAGGCCRVGPTPPSAALALLALVALLRRRRA